MHSVSFKANVDFSAVHSVFSDATVLDAVHGRGMWKFTGWTAQEDGTYTRTGNVKGVQVPGFARCFNKGKKHVICRVTQRYIPGDEKSEIVSTMHPKHMGHDLARNVSRFVMYPYSEGTCVVTASFTNSTTLPHPLSSMAIDIMDDMSKETLEYLQDAIALEK